MRLHWVTSELLPTPVVYDLMELTLPRKELSGRSGFFWSLGGWGQLMAFLLQFPLPNTHQVSLGVGGQASGSHLNSPGTIKHLLPIRTGEVVMCMCLCAFTVLTCTCSFCSYTYIHKTFLYNTILMEMQFFQNESSWYRSE